MNTLAMVCHWLCRIALLMLALFATVATAQTYSYRADTFSYDTPSAAAKTVSWHTTNAAACSGYPQGDDDWADITFASATTPANDFNFTFAGVAYSGLRIYSNGMLTFGNDNSGFWRTFNNATLPVTGVANYSAACPGSAPARVIVAYWTDIVAGTANSTSGASIKYELLGTAPSRRFVITWVNVKLYDTTTRYNFQVVLYETPVSGGNSNFKYQYTSGSSTGSAATVGVQVSTSDYTQYAYNQAYIDPAAGTAVLWYPATQFTGKQAEYRFDESLWDGTSGEVKDTATATFNAVRLGTAISTPDGKVCRGGDFPANTTTAAIDAVATPIAPASQGAITFWYKSNVRWNVANSDAMLIDATAAAARPFYLMKTASGALKFSIADSGGTVRTLTSANQSFNAGTWQHVGITWNIKPGSNQTVLKLFLNGAEVNSSRTTSTSGAITALSTVHIGDNRTAGVTPSGGTGNSANGYIDEVNFYATEINALQARNDRDANRTNCTSIDHFRIIHDGSVVNCGPATVTIEAHDVAHGLISLSGTTIQLTTSTGHGDWQLITGNGAVSNAGNGNASYTFSNEAVVILGLSNSYVESTNINVAAGSYTEYSGAAASCTAADYTNGTTCDANLNFAGAGFRFVDASNNPVAHQVAATASATYYLQAVQNTCTASGYCSGVCTSQFNAGTAVDIGLAYECRNPTSCQAGQTLTVTPAAAAGTGGAIAGNAAGAVSASTGSYTSRSLRFVATAPNPLPAVPFTFKYSDVGEVRLWARYPGVSSAPSVAGNSTAFIVKPAGFTLSEIKPTANTAGRCAVATTPAPAITCASGAADSAVFAKAGEAFSATVMAVNADGVATPNFGRETTPEGVKLTASKVIAAMTAVPSINGNFSAFSSGRASGTGFSWAEAGIITLTPSVADADYLGAGDVSGSASGNVGRFVPHHIDAVVSEACVTGGFTYSGQPMLLELTARDLVDNVTVNYSAASGLARALTFSPTPAVGAFSPPTAAAANFVGGIANATPAFAFTAAATPPTTVTVGGQDADGVPLAAAADISKKQTVAIRSGRLHLANAYGSEFLPMGVPARVQYWTAGGWLVNANDSCTVLTTPTSANGGLTNVLSAVSTASLLSPVLAGDARLRLNAPGAGNAGLVDISGSILRAGNTWLALPVATARACFGACGPRSPVIYLREAY
jgi:MSHA biogenesis protein MshQ